jgi:hypothetical protein
MTTKIDRKMALLKAYPRCIDIDRASPPVSPNVVAATLTTQNPIVTSGTLLKPVFDFKTFLGRRPDSLPVDWLKFSVGFPSAYLKRQ